MKQDGAIGEDVVCFTDVSTTRPLTRLIKARESFEIMEEEEPHAIRRRKILAKHPEIVKLYGHDHRAAILSAATVVLQLVLMYEARDLSMPCLIVATYAISGTLNHSLFLAMHEVSHDLFFKARWANRAFAFIVNIPMGVPASPYFKVYHKWHHSDLGVIGKDTDIPSDLEGRLFTGRLGRLVWLSLQPLFYIIRPLFVKPLDLDSYMVAGSVVQYSFDACVVWFIGWKSLFYLLIGSVSGGGIHPISGHFISEHVEFVKGQPTSSYYGPMNLITYNVGYHVEHHDFPRIPCGRLPLLRKIAPEWYNIPNHESWLKVLWQFVQDNNVSLFSRLVRHDTQAAHGKHTIS
jgi:sphingolipid delta-4 desaturase